MKKKEPTKLRPLKYYKEEEKKGQWHQMSSQPVMSLNRKG